MSLYFINNFAFMTALLVLYLGANRNYSIKQLTMETDNQQPCVTIYSLLSISRQF